MFVACVVVILLGRDIAPWEGVSRAPEVGVGTPASLPLWGSSPPTRADTVWRAAAGAMEEEALSPPPYKFDEWCESWTLTDARGAWVPWPPQPHRGAGVGGGGGAIVLLARSKNMPNMLQAVRLLAAHLLPASPRADVLVFHDDLDAAARRAIRGAAPAARVAFHRICMCAAVICFGPRCSLGCLLRV